MKTHGLVATYNSGCRCVPCTTAAREKQTGYRRARAQRDKAAREIVAALAKADPDWPDWGASVCVFCDEQALRPEDHAIDCVWRLAVEWTAA